MNTGIVIGTCVPCALVGLCALLASCGNRPGSLPEAFTSPPSRSVCGASSNACSMSGQRITSLDAADLDGDGDTDLVVAVSGPDFIEILINRGDGVFDRGARTASATMPSATAADFDGDGDTDFMMTDFAGVSVWTNDGTAEFSVGDTQSFEFPMQFLEIGDVDGDGDVDVVGFNLADTAGVLINDGSGMMELASTVSMPAGTFPLAGKLADFDGDDDLDLAVSAAGFAFTAQPGSPGVLIFDNDGTGIMTLTDTLDSGGEALGMQVGDVDGNGAPDLLIGRGLGIETSEFALFRGTPGGGFLNMVTQEAGRSPVHVTTGDVDGDGDLDVVSASYGDQAMAVLHNDGSGLSWTPGQVLTVNRKVANVRMVYLNDDPYLDLILIDVPIDEANATQGGKLVMLINDGTGRFE